MILFSDQEFDTDLPITLEDDMVPARIKVVGIGGGGGNAVNRMIDARMGGIQFIAANTDLQALRKCRAPEKLQLGTSLTRGLGAGGDPEIGRKSALEDTDRILELLQGTDMVFLTAGLGGGSAGFAFGGSGFGGGEGGSGFGVGGDGLEASPAFPLADSACAPPLSTRTPAHTRP